MAPQSNDGDIDSLVSAVFQGNDNWMWQLRDAEGQWIYMGGLVRFFARMANGKIGSGVGKIVKITSPTQAVVRVDAKNGGDVPGGDYLAESKNLTQASAIIPESTLRRLGIKSKPPANLSNIPNLSDMGKGAASQMGEDDDGIEIIIEDDYTQRYQSPDVTPGSSMARDAGSARDLPRVDIDGWENVSASSYLDEIAGRVASSQYNRFINDPSSASIIDSYKADGLGWEDRLRKDILDIQQDFIAKQAEAYENVDLYRLGNVTVAISKEFRAHPNKIDSFLKNIQKLRDNTKDTGGLVEVTILANRIPDDTDNDNYTGYARSSTVSYLDQNGKPTYDKATRSIIVDASVLLPDNIARQDRMDRFFQQQRLKAQRGDQAWQMMAAYSGGVDRFVEYVISHEWGHVIDFGDSPEGVTEEVDFNGKQEEASQFSARLAKLIQANPWILAALSEYGMTNPYEAFAELFAQVFMEKFSGAGIDSRIPDALRDFIEKYVF